MKYFLQTLGCQMNKSDSERIVSLVEQLGYNPVVRQQEADLILVNACSVRQSAEDRVYGQVNNWEKLKESNPNLIIAVTGCMPGRDKGGILRKRLPVVDLFFPINDLPQLPRWLAGLVPDIINTGQLEKDYLKINPKIKNAKQVWLTIMSGCSNYCTFCVVPYARGFERSRSVKDILKEAKTLIDKGCIAITLLGQNVNTFKPEDRQNFSKDNPYENSFAALLWEMNQLSGLERIHFTSPNPQDMSDEVIEALKLPKQVNFLHLPVQSGSDKILKKMNRRYTRKEYFEIIKKVKRARPDIALATDIIVGFPGETKKDFMGTVGLYKKVQFDISYTAIYSPRSGTAAYKAFKDDVPYREKKRRWDYLQEIMTGITLKKNQQYVGKIVSVLVEKYERGLLWGNSNEMKLVAFTGDKDTVGSIVPVRISEAQTWQLIGLAS